MGQYYYPVLSNASRKEDFARHIVATAYSHDFKNGLKLMEHSYIGNNFVAVIENALIEPKRVVWAGDYADEETEVTYREIGMTEDTWRDEGYGGKPNLDTHPNLWEIVSTRDDLKITESPAVAVVWQFILNHDKKQFVDLSKPTQDRWGFRVHPLPLLTAEGNGRGGGDYRGDDRLVGAWARDFVSVSNTAPEGWEELIPGFAE